MDALDVCAAPVEADAAVEGFVPCPKQQKRNNSPAQNRTAHNAHPDFDARKPFSLLAPSFASDVSSEANAGPGSEMERNEDVDAAVFTGAGFGASGFALLRDGPAFVPRAPLRGAILSRSLFYPPGFGPTSSGRAAIGGVFDGVFGETIDGSFQAFFAASVGFVSGRTLGAAAVGATRACVANFVAPQGVLFHCSWQAVRAELWPQALAPAWKNR